MYIGLNSLGLNTAPFAVSPVTALFQNGEPGAVFIATKPTADWTTNPDLVTMYQDSAGTTPVTALEQPVGLHLDTRPIFPNPAQLSTNAFGVVAGSDNTVTGTSSNGFTGNFVSTAVQVYQNITTVAGKSYAVSFVATSAPNNVSVVARSGSNGTVANISNIVVTNNGNTGYLTFTATTTTSSIVWGSSGSIQISGISIKENTTPNTVGQPLRGAELVTNGSNFVSTTGWTPANGTLSVVGGNLRLTASASGFVTATVSGTFTDSGISRYEGKAIIANASAKSVDVFARGSIVVSGTAATAINVRAIPVAGNNTEVIVIRFNAVAANDFIDITSASVKQVYGNHRSQSSAGARGVLSARYNRAGSPNANPTSLTGLEQSPSVGGTTFSIVNDAAALAAAGLSNICTLGNVYRMDNSTGTAIAQLNPAQLAVVPSSEGAIKHTIWARGSGNFTLRDDGGGQTFTLTAQYQKFTVTNTRAAGTSYKLRVQAEAGAVVNFILFDYRPACYSYLPDVQVVWDQTTGYDDTGFPARIKYSGAQGYQTAAIDFSGSGAAQAFLGSSQLSSATQLYMELGADANTNPGTFYIAQTGATNINGLQRGATTTSTVAITDTIPESNVVSLQVDVGSSFLQGRKNGVNTSSNSTAVGSTTLTNAVMNYGFRNGNVTLIPATFDEFISVVRGGSAPATGVIYSIEQYVAKQMGMNV